MSDLGFLRRAWPDMCACYRDVALGRACLEVQDKFGVDVPLLLVLAIADRVGQGIGPDDLDGLIAESEDWHSAVIEPLRRARQAMKGRFTAPAELGLRDDIKQLEHEAERLHVQRLAENFPASDTSSQSSALTYLTMRGASSEAAKAFLLTFNLAYDEQVLPVVALD